jgi:hypothetical protein
VLISGCGFGAMLDEESGKIHITPRGRLMQRSQPVLVVGCGVGAMLEQELGKIHITP